MFNFLPNTRYVAPSIAATRLYDQSQILSSPPNTDFTADPVLTSLAQLAAVRFDVAGAIISFFDTQNQYILAHATQSSSIIQPGHDDDLRQCCLLGKGIPRPSSFCEHVLLLAGTDGGTSEVSDDRQHLPISVIPDFANASRSSPPIGIPGLPDARFYAATPIRSPRGYRIGVFAVYGTQPRAEVHPRLTALLRDMSVTATSHLQIKETRTDLRRSERMVRGLGSFVEGAAGMSFNSATSNLESFRNEGAEGTLNSAHQDIQCLDGEQGSPSPFFANFRPVHRESHKDQTPSDPLSSPSADTPTGIKNVSPPESRDNQGPPPLSSSSTIGDEDEHLSSIKRLFSRAANIIRESIEVEGVVFADATLSSFGSLVGINHGSDASISTRSSSEEGLIGNSGSNSDDLCDILGYSTTTSSSLGKNTRIPDQIIVPERFLKNLLRRYPQGKIYHFNEDGSFSTAEDSSGNEVPSRPSTVQTQSEVSIPHKRRRTAEWSRQNESASRK